MSIRLNSAQRQAVEYLSGPLLVLAGPGTGKTQLLSSKVAYILEATDANPENILCLTFTDAGAVNMRDRLLSVIGRAATRVNIHTYHAFGSDLLARYRNYAEHFDRIFDSPIDAVTQFQIIQSIREDLPAFDILKSSITPTSAIIEVIQSAKSHRLTSDDLAKIAAANLAASRELNQELSPILENAPRGARYPKAVEQVYRPLLEVLTRYISDQPILKNIEPEANVLARSLNDALVEVENDPKHSVKPLGTWRDQTFEKDASGHFRLKNLIANKKLASVANIMAQYDQKLHTENLFDFNDMIEETINILKTDDGFRLDLSERFQYILLDEFQDTNPSQFELVRLLTDYDSPCIMAVGDDDQAIYAFQGANASNLIDFQNLYNAKVINLTENYRSTAEILALSKNIAAQITDSFAKKQGINKILTSVRNSDLLTSTSVKIQEKLTPISPLYHTSGKKSNLNTLISRHEFISPDAEYYWIAHAVKDLIDGGVSPSDIAILAPRHKLLIPIIPYLKAENLDIAYEKRENLLEDPKLLPLLTISEFVVDLASDKNPSHRLLEILSFPFWQISPLSVITALHHHKTSSDLQTLEYLANSSDKKLQTLATFLADLTTASLHSPLELMLDYLIGTTELNGFCSPYLEYYATATDNITSAPIKKSHSTTLTENTPSSSIEPATITENPHNAPAENQPTAGTYLEFELYNNLSVLRETLRAHFKNQKPLLKDLVNLVKAYTAASESIQNTSPYQDSANSVQVMTAHKSKGLEFKHVFLTSVDDKSWGNASGNRNLIVLPKNLTHIRHTGDTENECLRLLFVALTRAEVSLTLTNSIKSFSDTNLPRLAYLDEHEDENHRPVSPHLAHPQIQTHYDNLDEARHQTNLATHWIATYSQPLPSLRPILEKSLENYRLTASDLTSFIDLRYAGPAHFYRTRILGAPRDPATTEIILGNLMHATFEAVTSQGLTDAQALDFYQEKLQNENITSRDTTYLAEKGTKSLEISLQEFGELLRAPSAKAEVNLHHEHLVLPNTLALAPNSPPDPTSDPGIPLTGKIDHISINPDTKTIEIYDFKTGTYHPKSWTSHDSLYRYSLQLGLYKLLLNLSPTYQKYTVTRGHILYVTPDDNGEVYDKTYEYNVGDETFLKNLISAVYYQVKSLDFVKNPELFLTADANRSVSDIRRFAETLISLLGQTS